MEINEIKAELMKVHKEFIDTVNERFKTTAQKGEVDALLKEKESRLNEQIGLLEKGIKKLEQEQMKVAAIEKVDSFDKKYADAWLRWARKGDEREIKDLAKQDPKRLTFAGDEGILVPAELDAELYKVLFQHTELRRFATVRSVSGEKYSQNIRIDTGASGWVGETAARPALGAPTYKEFKPSFGEIYAYPEVTQVLLDDAGFDVAADLVVAVGEEFAEKEGTAFVSGDGTNKPKGFLTYAAGTAWGQIERVALPIAFAYQDLLDLIHTLPKPYRANAAWAMNSLTLATVRGITDEGGSPVFVPDINNAEGYRGLVMGYPVIESEDMPDVALSALPIAFANFARGYVIADVIGIRMLRDPFTNKPYVGFYTTKRVGGAVRDFRAIKIAENPAT